MEYHSCSSRLGSLLLTFCLLLLLAACSSTAITQRPASTIVPSAHSTPAPTPAISPRAEKSTSVPAIGKPLALKPMQTDCPTGGFARAALLRPLHLGAHPTLIYTTNDVSKDASTSMGSLKRYDSVTQRSSILAVSGHSISDAQVSSDGQWVLFLSQGSAGKGSTNTGIATRLQLIRVDGADLQTLYCAPSSVTISGMHWSANQKFVLLDMLDSNANTSTVRLLDVNAGTLKIELQTPFGASAYKTMIWLDSTRAYVDQGLSQPALYLLDVVHNDDIHGGALKKVSDFPSSGGAMYLESSVDKSLDAKTLFLSYCFPSGAALTSNITSQPATGGSHQTIYRNVEGCIKDLRVISNSRLLFTVRTSDQGLTRDVLLLANIDGSGTTVLYKDNALHVSIQLDRHGQLPWSNVSRDGALYAFSEQGAMVGVSKLLIGSLSTGKIIALISNSAGTISVAGWTTM